MKSSDRIAAGISLLLALTFVPAVAATHAAQAAANPTRATMPSSACHYRHWTTEQLASLQRALATSGFKTTGEPCWNHAMRAAVTAFQKKEGLKVTGFPNKKTRKALGLDW